MLSVFQKPRAAILAMVLAFGAAGFGLARAAQSLTPANLHASLKLADPNEGPSRNGFAPVVKAVLPDVVNISSSKIVRTPTDFSGQLPNAPFFQQFFGSDSNPGPTAPRDQREQDLGSGVIVSPEGYILTNNHVVDGATDIRVTFSDKRELKAKVVGTDPKADIAVLKVEGSNFPTITIGDSSKVQVGDYALAIGDPFGVGQTVTMGIVSATNRGNLGIEDYEDFIQTDAPINPGNSGGALINDRGELIGINTAILSHGSGGNEGIGFAVPVNVAREVMDQILEHGKVTRAYLGIVPQNVTPALAKVMGQKETNGVLVGDVSADSPAHASGLQRGDIILKVNDKPINDSNELRNGISLMMPGASVKLTVLRDGTTREMFVKLGELPDQQAKAEVNQGPSKSALEGVSVEDMNSQSADQLGMPAGTTGVVVTNINPSSPEAESGLSQGDVIQEVNHHTVKNVSEFEEAIHKAGTNPLLLVNRHGMTLFIAA
jgi:serine protease Do